MYRVHHYASEASNLFNTKGEDKRIETATRAHLCEAVAGI
jgi:hypothetical protein